MKQFIKGIVAATMTALLCTMPALAADVPQETGDTRVSAVSINAEVLAIDYDTRELSIRSPLGDIINVTASDAIERLDEIAVGDLIVMTYIASLGGELREPTAEELAEPWLEMDAAAIAGQDMDPGAVVGMAIRAVCTIEGLNRVTRTVTVKDPRGKYHVIGDVDPEKMEGVTLGTTVVITYTQALAVTLEEKPAAE